jgi:hypothetical protein
MRKFLFALASTGGLATMNASIAQYPADGYYSTGNNVPGYYGRRYYAPGYPGYYAPGYMWREQRSATQMPENYEKQRTPNNALSGPIGLGDPNAFGGECAKGFSEETCRRRGQKYNPPGQN